MGRRVVVGVVLAVVALVGAVGFVWWRSQSEPPPALSVDGVPDGATPAAADSAAPADLDGRWTVESGSGSQAGLRIREERFGGLADNTAVGRSTAVTGSMDMQGTQVQAASFRVDLSKLAFSDDPGLPVAQRSEYLRTRSLETDRFPDASFRLTTPIRLGSLPKPGTTITATATGRLTLHGKTKAVTFRVQAKLVQGRIRIATATPVKVSLPAYGIEVPSIPKVSEVADTGQFEFLVVLSR